jgi:ribulose 1,5-bisphosphate carboxylase large subunit-like protein
MGLCYYNGEVIAYSLPEESTHLPPSHELEYFTLEDVINDHVIVTYSYESEKSREEIVRRIIYEQTRWKDNTCKPLPPEHVGRVQIAYDISQLSSLQQLFNLFCLHAIKSFDRLMVEEIYVPERFRNELDLKPRFGIKGIRELLKVSDRPLLHVVIPPYLKEKEETATFIQQLSEAGVDAVGDHQFMGLGLAEFQERIEKVVEIIENYSQKSSHKMVFYPYIEGENFMEKMDFVKDSKCKYVGLGLSPISFGIPATVFARKNYPLPLHFHLTLHGIYTRLGQSYYSLKEGFRSGHGISINVILKLFAFCGGDEVNVDYYGYYSVHPEEIKTQCSILRRLNVFPALVGGIGLDNIEDLVLNYGKDTIVKIGGERFLKFPKKEQIKGYIRAYKDLLENTITGKFEDSEEIKKWKDKEKMIRDADQKFLMGVSR